MLNFPGAPYATKPDHFHREPSYRVPFYCNANLTRVPDAGCEQFPCGDQCEEGGPRPDAAGEPFQIQKHATPVPTQEPKDEERVFGIHEKLDAIMMVVDSIDTRLARIEKDIEQFDSDDESANDSDESNESNESKDSEDSDDSIGTDESAESYGSDDSADSGDSGGSFDLGELVTYIDGEKKRLGRIAAIDASHTPVSYTIKFEDEEERYRDTEADKLQHL